ncbi:MAG: lipoprotein NlpD [Gammaproteobacteria bacterium]
MVFVAVKRCIVVMAVLLLTACVNLLTWEEQSSQSYTVKPGDTLFGIAWVYKVDRQELAWWNGISDPTSLKVGQTLRLDGSGQVGAPRIRPTSNPPVTASQRNPAPAAKRQPSRPSSASKRKSTSRPRIASGPAIPPGKWGWPYARPVKRNYGSGRHGRDGLGFDVVLNDKLYAASSGKVVYVGSHHKQLGGLVVIHHADDVVSAYAFCGKMVVKLGQQVATGQHIANVGYDPKGQPAFNFGIRKAGKSQDVLAYLPKRK